MISAENYGDPLSKLSGSSAGQGFNGLGNGKGGGLGNGEGTGVGDGIGGGTYRAGGDVSSPILISKVEPEYSDEARKAKYSGTVLLSIEAVQKWRFRAGVKNGHPVRVRATVEVSFRLL